MHQEYRTIHVLLYTLFIQVNAYHVYGCGFIEMKPLILQMPAQLTLASNPAVKENAAWIQLFRLSQQFPEIWDFEYTNSIQIPRFLRHC